MRKLTNPFLYRKFICFKLVSKKCLISILLLIWKRPNWLAVSTIINCPTEAIAASAPILWLLPVAPLQNLWFFLFVCHLQSMRLPISQQRHLPTATHPNRLTTSNFHLRLHSYLVPLLIVLLELSATPLLFFPNHLPLDMSSPNPPSTKPSVSIVPWPQPQPPLLVLTRIVFVVYTKPIAILSGTLSRPSMVEVYPLFYSRKPGSKVSPPTDHQPHVYLQICLIWTEQAITTTAKPLKDYHHQFKKLRIMPLASQHFSVLMPVPVAPRREKLSRDWRKVERCLKWPFFLFSFITIHDFIRQVVHRKW